MVDDFEIFYCSVDVETDNQFHSSAKSGIGVGFDGERVDDAVFARGIKFQLVFFVRSGDNHPFFEGIVVEFVDDFRNGLELPLVFGFLNGLFGKQFHFGKDKRRKDGNQHQRNHHIKKT